MIAMPYAPPRSCKCGAIVPHGQRCQRCAKASDHLRGSPASRGYDAAWRKVRAEYLAEYPACCVHGCCAPATDVDHVVSIRDRPDLRLSWSNLRGMCHSHHATRTITEQGINRSRG